MLTPYQLVLKAAAERDIEVFLLAGDIRGPLSGNKHLKLKPWLHRVVTDHHKGLIGVGGVWSNFILSLALSCRKAGIPSNVIIRGDEHVCRTPTAMLLDAADAGMHLHYVSRAEYRLRTQKSWQEQWTERYPGYLWVPEGGSDINAAAACQSLGLTSFKATHWVVAAGTGATAAGVASAIPPSDNLIVVNVSADPNVEQTVREWSERLRHEHADFPDSVNKDVRGTSAGRLIFPEAPDVRFGKLTPELCKLTNQCFEQSGVLLDPVYTAKALQQVQLMIRNWTLSPGARLALIHTGGLQGWRGYIEIERHRQNLSESVIDAIESLYPAA